MIGVVYTKISDGTILLQGENDETFELVAKSFDTLDEAIEYADNN